MRIYIVIAGLWSITLCGMENAFNFLLDTTHPLSVEQIRKASDDLAKSPIEKMKDSKQILSEALYSLSVGWLDDWGNEGIEFAKNLIAKGADPKYPHTETEVLVWGKTQPYKESILVNTETAFNRARGKLHNYFMLNFTPKHSNE